MSLTLHDASIAVFVDGFESMSDFLKAGRAFADEKGIDHAELIGSRLFDDMAPLSAQVQRASDTSRLALSRVAAIDAPAMAYTETSFDELQARIAATVAYLKSVPADAVNARADAETILPLPQRQVVFTGTTYMLRFAVPNFYFHLTTAYDVLRSNGVPIGKRDYLGWLGLGG